MAIDDPFVGMSKPVSPLKITAPQDKYGVNGAAKNSATAAGRKFADMLTNSFLEVLKFNPQAYNADFAGNNRDLSDDSDLKGLGDFNLDNVYRERYGRVDWSGDDVDQDGDITTGEAAQEMGTWHLDEPSSGGLAGQDYLGALNNRVNIYAGASTFNKIDPEELDSDEGDVWGNGFDVDFDGDTDNDLYGQAEDDGLIDIEDDALPVESYYWNYAWSNGLSNGNFVDYSNYFSTAKDWLSTMFESAPVISRYKSELAAYYGDTTYLDYDNYDDDNSDLADEVQDDQDTIDELEGSPEDNDLNYELNYYELMALAMDNTYEGTYTNLELLGTDDNPTTDSQVWNIMQGDEDAMADMINYDGIFEAALGSDVDLDQFAFNLMITMLESRRRFNWARNFVAPHNQAYYTANRIAFGSDGSTIAANMDSSVRSEMGLGSSPDLADLNMSSVLDAKYVLAGSYHWVDQYMMDRWDKFYSSQLFDDAGMLNLYGMFQSLDSSHFTQNISNAFFNPYWSGRNQATDRINKYWYDTDGGDDDGDGDDDNSVEISSNPEDSMYFGMDRFVLFPEDQDTTTAENTSHARPDKESIALVIFNKWILEHAAAYARSSDAEVAPPIAWSTMSGSAAYSNFTTTLSEVQQRLFWGVDYDADGVAQSDLLDSFTSSSADNTDEEGSAGAVNKLFGLDITNDGSSWENNVSGDGTTGSNDTSSSDLFYRDSADDFGRKHFHKHVYTISDFIYDNVDEDDDGNYPKIGKLVTKFGNMLGYVKELADNTEKVLTNIDSEWETKFKLIPGKLKYGLKALRPGGYIYDKLNDFYSELTSSSDSDPEGFLDKFTDNWDQLVFALERLSEFVDSSGKNSLERNLKQLTDIASTDGDSSTNEGYAAWGALFQEFTYRDDAMTGDLEDSSVTLRSNIMAYDDAAVSDDEMFALAPRPADFNGWDVSQGYTDYFTNDDGDYVGASMDQWHVQHLMTQTSNIDGYGTNQQGSVVKMANTGQDLGLVSMDTPEYHTTSTDSDATDDNRGATDVSYIMNDTSDVVLSQYVWYLKMRGEYKKTLINAQISLASVIDMTNDREDRRYDSLTDEYDQRLDDAKNDEFYNELLNARAQSKAAGRAKQSAGRGRQRAKGAAKRRIQAAQKVSASSHTVQAAPKSAASKPKAQRHSSGKKASALAKAGMSKAAAKKK